MAVVPAGVHLAGVLRAVGHVVLFLDRERVHVGAEQHGLARARAAHRGEHAGLAHAGTHLEPEGSQAFGHDPGGTHLLERQLGVSVEVAARFDQLLQFGGR